ncbi:hypothetical protein ACHAW5_009286 [Stephanodiscus triporus]|uniref:Uncharacterized protein n=1 Tax=Stephanodiscus triporus TaxID=2934178 RepID=A0ABD3NNM0_9STRA
MLTSKKTASSFGPDGRRVSSGDPIPPPRFKCVGRAGSGFSSKPAPSSRDGGGGGGGGGGDGGRSVPSSDRGLFRPGARLIIARAPVMAGLSVSGPSAGLLRKFQRPMTKRRSYDKGADLALKTSTLGQKRRFDGMARLFARAGKGLSYSLPGANRGGEEGGTSDESNSDDDDDEGKEDDRPFEPLLLWKSPHQGGEAKGLPPRLSTITRPDEYGVEETVTELVPAPIEAYAKESAFAPAVLAKFLRPHQREGVQFMYECVMSLKDFNGAGCILADDMGLGKTLQSVTLIWTLLQTGITANKERSAKRVIVICPCSLVKNWDNEFVKWLGPGVVKTLALAESDRKTVEKNIDCFVKTKMFNVLIASYETMRTHVGRINKYKDCCDLLVCDEAHRLKNRENQTAMALSSIPCKRRVLLTGTPMQNDLEEFFAMVDFTNPGVLGTQEEFRRQTLAPILRGREPGATEKQKQRMLDIQQEMSSTVNNFILRRVNTLNAQHLPPKLVQVVCCNPTEIQQNMYAHLCNSKDMQHVLDGKQVNCLGSIQMLMKLCNHPSLVVGDDESSNIQDRRGGRAKKKICYAEEEKSSAAPGADGIARYMPREAMGGGRNAPVMPELSGKMFVLWRLMRQMRMPGNGADKIVIVSNYTQTLDLIGRMCQENNWGFCRLDGSISMKKRQKMCDDFNDPSSSLIAFLLSSKAGGCGLNLIGGNRLVLFDPDWNPAVDKQAAARCWRDGQKKRCFTYRFLTTGTVEEKIFQRQLSKEGLQSVVDDKEQVNALSTKDLKNLFKLRQGTPSDTHDKLKCERCRIIVDDAEAEAVKVLPKKLAACRELFEQLMLLEDSASFLTPLKPEEHGASLEEYQKLVKQPMDFGTVLNKIDKKNNSTGYSSPAAFSKDVNRVFSNVLKVWEPGQELADAAARLQLWWIQKWTELVPTLMLMKSDRDNDERENEPQHNDDDVFQPTASLSNERGEDYQEQIGMPDEENMRNWSHHHSTDTVDDPIFRAAMRGYDTVSFVFGLEVTWSLIQQRQQFEEERQAMLELESMKEMNESFDMKDCALKEDDDNENDDEDGRDEQNQDCDETQNISVANTRCDATEEEIMDEESHVTTETESTSFKDKYDGDATFALLDDSEASCAKLDATEPKLVATDDTEMTEQESEAAMALTAVTEKKAPDSQSSQWTCETCTFANDRSKRKCQMCETKRPRTRK